MADRASPAASGRALDGPGGTGIPSVRLAPRRKGASVPVIRRSGQLPLRRGEGWSWQDWAGPAAFGEPVPMEASRHQLGPGAASPVFPLAGTEALAYVISGSGTATAGGEDFPLAPESVLWLAGCDGIRLQAGPGRLHVLVAETAAAGTQPAPLRKLLTAAELPHLVSTRDTRDRLDLVTDEVPVGAARIRADRIIYHPGDTSASHYHTGSYHVFCVLAGSGLLHDRSRGHRLTTGMSALVRPGEVHWFENDRAADFAFAEFWAPPPAATVWTVLGDRCTWAPA